MYYKYRTNKDFNYNSLSLQQENELKKVQLRHKTMNADDLFIEAVKDIMETKTNVSEFDNYDHFVSVVQRTELYSNTDVFDEINGSTDKNYCISKIPVTWLKKYLLTIPEMKYRRDISTQYLTYIMEQIGYTKKVSRYNGKPNNCYISKSLSN